MEKNAIKLSNVQLSILDLAIDDACPAFPLPRWPEGDLGPLLVGGFIRLSRDKKTFEVTDEGYDAFMNADAI